MVLKVKKKEHVNGETLQLKRLSLIREMPWVLLKTIDKQLKLKLKQK